MKKTNLKILVLLIPLSFSFTFVCFKYSTLNFQDEWVGRGLYPGLAFFHGLDFYEPQTGPHVSLYGWSTGLFYSMCGFANTPNQAISLAFMINLFFLISLIVLLFWKSINLTIKCNILSVSIISSLTCLLTFISLMDGTTDAIFKIHADMPAMSFLVLSIIFFRSYIVKKTKFFLFLTVLNLILSVWAKLPTLPALVFPILYLVSEKKFKKKKSKIAVIGSSSILSNKNLKRNTGNSFLCRNIIRWVNEDVDLLDIPPSKLDRYTITMSDDDFKNMTYLSVIIPALVVALGFFVSWLRKEL